MTRKATGLNTTLFFSTDFRPTLLGLLMLGFPLFDVLFELCLLFRGQHRQNRLATFFPLGCGLEDLLDLGFLRIA